MASVRFTRNILDILKLIGRLANATEEFFVRRSPLYEVVGQLGMWGTLINGIQAAGLEHKAMTQASWNGSTSECPLSALPPFTCLKCGTVTVGLLVAYTAAMFILYTVAPILYRMASSAYYNLSLLSSDFYGLLFGLFLFVSPLLCSCSYVLLRSIIALHRVLAVLCRFCCRHLGLDYLFLGCHTYVFLG
jgi:hypothetical protein